MKINKLILIVLLFNFVFLFSYQPSETRFSPQQLNPLTYEMKVDGNFSKVVLIDSVSEFVKLVVNNSQPVVLRVFSSKSDSMKNIFHSVADKINGKIFFAAVDIDVNDEFVSFLKSLFTFNGKQLPLVLFFINKQVVLPILAGKTSKSQLSQEIKARFKINF